MTVRHVKPRQQEKERRTDSESGINISVEVNGATLPRGRDSSTPRNATHHAPEKRRRFRNVLLLATAAAAVVAADHYNPWGEDDAIGGENTATSGLAPFDRSVGALDSDRRLIVASADSSIRVVQAPLGEADLGPSDELIERIGLDEDVLAAGGRIAVGNLGAYFRDDAACVLEPVFTNTLRDPQTATVAEPSRAIDLEFCVDDKSVIRSEDGTPTGVGVKLIMTDFTSGAETLRRYENLISPDGNHEPQFPDPDADDVTDEQREAVNKRLETNVATIVLAFLTDENARCQLLAPALVEGAELVAGVPLDGALPVYMTDENGVLGEQLTCNNGG